MKVLFFVHSFPCVSETFVLNQVTGLVEKGHDVRVYGWGVSDSTVHEDYYKYDLERITWRIAKRIPKSKLVRVIKILPTILYMFAKPGLSPQVLYSKRYGLPARNLSLFYIAKRLLKESWKPDVVVSHFGDVGLLMTALRQAGVVERLTPCYTFFHAHEICRMNAKEISSFYGPMFTSSDILLPISQYWMDRLIAAGANKANVRTFHMGIDTNRFKFTPRTLENDELTILSVGRLVGQKGYEYALKGVADYIKSSKKKVTYYIIGAGELDASLKKMACSLGISDSVFFMGAQPQEVVSEYMKLSDIFLLPSITDSAGFMEGIPVALMEAMASGLICISTKHSGIPELIEDCVTGFLCEEKDSIGIAEKMRYIESLDSNQIYAIEKAALDKVYSDFNIKKLIDDLSRVICR